MNGGGRIVELAHDGYMYRHQTLVPLFQGIADGGYRVRNRREPDARRGRRIESRGEY